MQITMNNSKLHLLLWLTAMMLFGFSISAAQSGSQQPKKKVPTLEEAKVYHEAYEWVRKAQAMIGTPKENSDEQAELFLKAIKIKPDFLEAHFDLGLVYANQKKMQLAVTEFETVLKIDPKFDEEVYFLIASAYQELGNSNAAMAALQQGLQKKPKDPKMLKALAYLQFHGSNDAAAIDTLNRLLEVEPTDTSSRIDLGLLYQKSNDLDKAIAAYQEVLRSEPTNFTARYNLGLIYLRQRKNAEAAAELESANQIQPGNPELLERLGDAYAFQREHQKAANAYQAALEKSPDRGALYSKLGFSLANLNLFEAAANALEKAVHLNPRNADTFFLLGDMYSELKRTDEAVSAYKKSLEIDPKQKEVHYNLGTLYAEQKRFDEAMAELKFAVQLDPDYSSAWANIALVAEKLELDKEAIDAHEKLIALGKGQALNYFHLGVLYAKTGQNDSSIAAFAKAIELEPEKYRAMLREELKKVHSVLDNIRYKEAFMRLVNPPQNQ
jgi:tetratricopeptide (TPR) repeat protein